MTPAIVEPRPWPARRWWIAITIAFAVQVALVFWLQNRPPTRPATPPPTSVIHFVEPDNHSLKELLALEDPTLFVLPHPQAFSGPAWLTLPPSKFQSADYSEPAQLLTATNINEWGACLAGFVKANPTPPFPTITMPRPQITISSYLPIVPPSAASRLRLTGDLARRRLVTPLHLQSWTNTDLLTNSVVQVLVNDRGNIVSALLLRPAGLAAAGQTNQANADQLAVDLARSARFAPLPETATPVSTPSIPRLSIGSLIFEWQTILAPATNSPASPP